MIYVEIIKRVLPHENEKNKGVISVIKVVHNLGLSIASLLMFIGIVHAAWESGKLNSVHNSLCLRFVDEHKAGLVGRYFYLSKYWEWLDTAFLVIGKKEISWLQYTHHMSTAILVYANVYPIISSASLLACFTNTLVHVFMYIYFAFPSRFRPYRKWITTLQIVQHFCCLSGFIYIYNHMDQCYTTTAGIEMALALYAMYLTFFLLFYIVQYSTRSDDKSGKGKASIKKEK
jgi:hypothetical protein